MQVQVQGDLDRTLRLLIQRAIGEPQMRPNSRFDARRRAREAGESAISVLRSEGYYDYVVEPDVAEGDTLTPVVRITTGPRYVFADPRLVWDGPPPDAAASASAQRALALRPGAPGRAADVLAAEGRVVAMIDKRGYADAFAKPREVVVDHSDHTVRPTLHIAAGSLVHLGGLNVVTNGRTSARWVTRLTPWKKGAVYDPDKVAELDRRLRDLSVFQSVTVALAPANEAVDGLRPVVVSLADRPAHRIELGAGYSTSEGAGVEAKWIQYNWLHRADTITFTAALAQINSKLDVELDLPDWLKPTQTLKLGGDLIADNTSAYNDVGGGLRVDVDRRRSGSASSFANTSYVTYGLAADFTDTSEKTAVNANAIPVGVHLKLIDLSALAAFAMDRSDDPLNPKRGWRLEARAEPTFITGDRTLGYLKAQVQATGYLSVGPSASTVLAARFNVGSIIGGKIPVVPADRRFYAGGGGSVRGYNYQGVGPRLSDNTPEGGLSLFESSVEVRQHIVGPWGIAAFVDAGSVGLHVTPDFRHVSAGAGVGVRYDLGFGPIRFDVATPLNPRKGDPVVQIYVSVGQAF
ncbi:MAG: autotransporter assembly complex family protein [Caulobacterales bacterium]